ncbi:hypothetical protein H6800_01040 [Candidatus Nomurabacteria bacterium]|nr:hypothetical protein [Candidatus Nomurabacteria bacterium]
MSKLFRFSKGSIVGLVVFVSLLLTIFSPNFAVASKAATRVPCSNNKALLDASVIGLPTYGCGSDTSIIQTLTKLAFGALTMLSLLFIVIGGMRYALSGGDGNAIATAKKTIMYAVIGLVLGISVFVITSFIFGALS